MTWNPQTEVYLRAAQRWDRPMWRETEAACKSNSLSLRHNSREESSKLRNELQLPAAGEVDRLPAAFDAAANTCPLHLAPTARLQESFTTCERTKQQQRVEKNDV